MYVQVLDRLQSALWVFKIRFSSRTGLFLWTGLGRLKYLCFGERNSVAAWCLVSLDFIPPLCEGHLAPCSQMPPACLQTVFRREAASIISVLRMFSTPFCWFSWSFIEAPVFSRGSTENWNPEPPPWTQLCLPLWDLGSLSFLICTTKGLH